MIRSAIPTTTLGAALGVILSLTISCTRESKNQATRAPDQEMAGATPQRAEIPLCTGSPSTKPGGDAPVQATHPHSVTLSWNAPLPKSYSPQDAINGYYVYRSVQSHIYAESNRISRSVLPGTRCVDTAIEPQKTYFYVVKAVTQGGKLSDFSSEVKAVVPSP